LQSPPEQRRLSPAAAVVILVFVLLLISRTVRLLWVPIQFFIIASLVALALSHPVNWLQRRRVPRLVAIIVLLALVLAAIGAFAGVFLPPLTRQAADLVDNLPTYWQGISARLQDITRHYPWIQERISELDVSRETTRRLQDIVSAGWQFAVGVAGAVMLALLLIITVVFMLANPRPLINGLVGVVPEPWDAQARRIGALLAVRLRAWIRGLIVLGAVIGVAVGIGLWALGVRYAVLFGVLAGVLEMVPTVGPVLSAIPPILVALAGEPIRALWVLLLFIGVQQVENTLLVPLVMRRQLQLHPVSTILGFIALGTLFGVFGAIIAVPTVACLKVLYDEVYYPWAHPAAAAKAAAAAPPEEAPAAQEADAES